MMVSAVFLGKKQRSPSFNTLLSLNNKDNSLRSKDLGGYAVLKTCYFSKRD